MNGPGSTEQPFLREQRSSAGSLANGRSGARLVSGSAVRSAGLRSGAPATLSLKPVGATNSNQPDPQEDLTTAPITPSSVSLSPRIAPMHEQQMSGKLGTVWNLVDRTARLSMDAVLLLVFSPVIAVWWLVERHNRKA